MLDGPSDDFITNVEVCLGNISIISLLPGSKINLPISTLPLRNSILWTPLTLNSSWLKTSSDLSRIIVELGC
jgi:hypothetical protein